MDQKIVMMVTISTMIVVLMIVTPVVEVMTVEMGK